MRKSRASHVITLLSAFLLLASSVTGFVMLPQWVYYIVLGFLFLWYIQQSFPLKVAQPLVILFWIISAISIMANQPPSFFNAWGRLAGFVMIVMVAAPVFSPKKALTHRNLLFSSLMWLCVILSVGSFACYFLGINFFVRNDEVLAIAAGHFSGLFCHSMLLGPIAGLSAIFTFSTYLGKAKRPTWLLFVTLCCISSSLLSASRAAVGSCILGLIIVYLCKNRGQLSRSVIVGLFVVGLLAASYPLWGGLTDFVLEKQESNMNMGGTFMSREGMWLDRISEIKKSPVFGVGFCCVDIGSTYVNMSAGTIEPGTSWLAVFSMTGVFGFITFVALFINTIRRAYSMVNKEASSLFCGYLAFFSLHLLFEGYVLSAGSILGFMFWLTVGCVWEIDNYYFKKVG